MPMAKASGTVTSGRSGAGTDSKKLQFKSPAEFFANNKNIAGFDNPGKSLYTTIREFVENSLDAAEYIRALPEIQITIEELTQEQLYQLRGMESRQRVNESLYRDYEKQTKKTTKRPTKKQKLSLDATDTDDTSVPNTPQLGNHADPAGDAKGRKHDQQEKSKSSSAMYYRVTVKDNGSGMPHHDVPQMLGRVLAGTNYAVKQARGKFGLGAKMALIWSKMSTGCPVQVHTAKKGKKLTFCRLDIDIVANRPHVLEHTELPNPDGTIGTEISVIIEGSWTSYRAKILKYLRQLAIITPYAHLEFRFATTKEKYERRSTNLPQNPIEVKYHPSSVDLLTVKKLISDSVSKQHSLRRHLVQQYSCIDTKLANSIIDELGKGFQYDLPVNEMSEKQILRLTQLFKEMKFAPPDGECLSPVGEYNLRLGIMKELNPDMVATFQEKTRVFEGHPFIVEAGVSLGGKTVSPGINISRFANRIPLLFEAGADVVSRTAMEKIKWQNYRIKPNVDKIGVFVSIVSTKIPFKGTGKEYIGDDITEIAAAVKKALQQCCLQLKAKLARAAELKSQAERKSSLRKYIPLVSKAIFDVLKNTAQATMEEGGSMPTNDLTKRDLLQKILDSTLTQQHLVSKLNEHVDLADMEQALEFVERNKVNDHERFDFCLAPYRPRSDDLLLRHPGLMTLRLHQAPAAPKDPM